MSPQADDAEPYSFQDLPANEKALVRGHGLVVSHDLREIDAEYIEADRRFTEWFYQALSNRPPGQPVVIIPSRLDENDLTGHLEDQKFSRGDEPGALAPEEEGDG